MKSKEYEFWNKAKNTYVNNLPDILAQTPNVSNEIFNSGLGANFFLLKEDSVKYIFHKFYDNQFNFTYLSTQSKILLNYPIGLSIYSDGSIEGSKAAGIYRNILRPQRSFKENFYVFINIEFEKDVILRESKENKNYNKINDYRHSSGLYKYENSGEITKVSELTFYSDEIDRDASSLTTITSTSKALYFQNGENLIQWEGQKRFTTYKLPFYELKLFSNSLNNSQSYGNQNSNVSILEWKDNLLFAGGEKNSFTAKLYLTKRKNSVFQLEKIISKNSKGVIQKTFENLSPEQVKEQFMAYMNKWDSIIKNGSGVQIEKFENDFQSIKKLFEKINFNEPNNWFYKYWFVYVIYKNEMFEESFPILIELDQIFKKNNDLRSQYLEEFNVINVFLLETYSQLENIEGKVEKTSENLSQEQIKVKLSEYINKWDSIFRNNGLHGEIEELDKDIQIIKKLLLKINSNDSDKWIFKYWYAFIINKNKMYAESLPILIELDQLFKKNNNLINQHSEKFYMIKALLIGNYVELNQDLNALAACDELIKSGLDNFQFASQVKEKILNKSKK